LEQEQQGVAGVAGGRLRAPHVAPELLFAHAVIRAKILLFPKGDRVVGQLDALRGTVLARGVRTTQLLQNVEPRELGAPEPTHDSKVGNGVSRHRRSPLGQEICVCNRNYRARSESLRLSATRI